MSTSLTHAFIGSTFSLAGGGSISRSKLAIALAVLAVLPDLDVLFIPLGLGHHPLYGHRGFMHSLAFAAVIGLLTLAILFRQTPCFSRDWWTLWGLFFMATASHGLLDALTYLGGGVALLAPFDNTRYAFPWRPLPAPPVNVGRIQDYFPALLVEFRRVWLPVGAIAAAFWGVSRIRSKLGIFATRSFALEKAGTPGDGAVSDGWQVRPLTGGSFAVLLGCLGILCLIAFLKPESTHEIQGVTISYAGLSEAQIAAAETELKEVFEKRHEDVLSLALLHWDLALNEEPSHRFQVMQTTDEMLLGGGGSAGGDLAVPLEYRFRIRGIAPKPDRNRSGAVAFDLEVEWQVEDKHATAARLMEELIRDRLSLLLCHELDKWAERHGVTLTRREVSDPALSILPLKVGARTSSSSGASRAGAQR